MKIIKLDATPSTNSYLKQLAQERSLDDFTMVRCDHQTEGRGQKGNSWVSDKGKNLTFSILKRFEGLKVGKSFSLNCLVSLAIFDVLNTLEIPDVTIKWPNDIMSGNKKLCGILIENSLSGAYIKQSIIGIGLNVNQTDFSDLPNATSMSLASKNEYNLETMFLKILDQLAFYLDAFRSFGYNKAKESYENTLFRKDILSKFVENNGESFEGYIRGITESGLLKIERKNGIVNEYAFKEVKMVF